MQESERTKLSGFVSPRRNASRLTRHVELKFALFTVVALVTLIYLTTSPKYPWYDFGTEHNFATQKSRIVIPQKYEDFTAKGFIMQIENYGRFSNLIIELLHLALMARALDRIAITSMGLEYLPAFDLNELNMIASGRTCTAGETNPAFCCRIKGWHYDEDPVVIKFIEGRDQTVPDLLKDRKNWSTGCRILFREHRAESTDGFRITQLLANKHYMDRDCGTTDEPTCITADLLGPLHSPPTSQQIPVLSVEGRILFSLNVAEEPGSNSALQKYLNLLQSVSPPTLSYSSAVKTAGSALYQHSLQRAAVPEDSPTTVAIHMRLGDVSDWSASPSLWKKWVDMTHPDSKVAFIGTNANQWEMEEIKGLFPDALIGCPHDLFPQCAGPMLFAIEQMSMSLHTYFGGFEPSTYSSNIATHRLLLGHSIYSVMAFGGQPGTLGDLKPFERMDSGFGALTAL